MIVHRKAENVNDAMPLRDERSSHRKRTFNYICFGRGTEYTGRHFFRFTRIMYRGQHSKRLSRRSAPVVYWSILHIDAIRQFDELEAPLCCTITSIWTFEEQYYRHVDLNSRNWNLNPQGWTPCKKCEDIDGKEPNVFWKLYGLI